MIHLGNITKINGAEIPKVDVITGGSPCQDLSVAGKRAGLNGERSGLFMEQIRIIKEMREDDRRTGRADRFIRPRFMVWENVPGALSSGKPKGEDFRIVLEETARVADQTATVPRPKDGKWSNSGTILGDGFSISWRVHDAQFWGVPQRRRRISLVADFNGHRSAEILFERKSVSRNSEKSKGTWERTAESVERSVGETGITCLNDQGGSVMGVSKNVTGALRAQEHGHQPMVAIGVPLGFKAESTYLYDNVGTTVCNGTRPGFTCGVIIESHPNDSRIKIRDDGVCQSLSGRMETGGNNTPLVFGISSYSSNAMKSSNPHSGVYEAETARTLDLNGGSPTCNQGGIAVVEKATYQNVTGAPDCGMAKVTGQQLATSNMFVANSHAVRRLTPLECERLQGFPDGWTDIGEWIDSKGKKRKDADSPRYKALGNSIALPFWEWLAKRICAEYDRPITMGSLFDGIGGFPLAFERAGAKAVWASEIEEFCIAVTKLRFPEGDELSEPNE
jgi:DNA (cytosine-5)-methyltransferase 1